MEKTRTVLIVDDEQDVLETVTSYLSQQGFRVVATSRWTEAIAQFQEAPPDIVLLDLYLPTVQGEALLEFIREIDKDLPVVIVSSTIDSEKMEHLGRLGASGFVQKPFETADLLLVVEQVLAEHAVVMDETAAGDRPDIEGGAPPVPAPAPPTPEALPRPPSPARFTPGAGVEALQREQQSSLSSGPTRRRRVQKRRGKGLKRLRNYILTSVLFVLIAVLFWTLKKTISNAGFLGIGISIQKEQVE